MSTKYHLTPSTASSAQNLLSKIPVAIIVLLLVMITSVFLPNPAFAADVGALGVGGDSSEETVSTPSPDSFGRDTPRQTVQGFISALGENDYLLASNYLNLSKSAN